jgi:hypothetical protein
MFVCVGFGELSLLFVSSAGQVEPSAEADILAVRQLLGLDPQGGEFQVVHGSVATSDKKIAILMFIFTLVVTGSKENLLASLE